MFSFGNLLSAAGGLGLSALGAGGSLLQAGSAIFSSAFGMGTQAGGAVINGVVSGIGTALRGGSFAASVTAAIGGALTGALVAGITSSVRSAVQQSRSILDLSQATGIGLGASTRANYNLRAFGISPDSVTGISSGNSVLQGLRSSAFGVTGTPGSAEYLRSYSQRYQNSDIFMRQSMESSLGMQGARFMAGLSPEMRERQLSRSQNMQNALGMNPDEVRRNAQEMQLLTSAFSQFFGLLRDKAGAAIIRHLTVPLGHALDWLERNSGRIGAGIEKGVDKAFEAFHKIGSFLYADFPILALSSLEAIADAAGNLASQLPDTFSELGTMVKGSLLDALSTVPSLIGELFAPVGKFLQDTILPPLETLFGGVESLISRVLDNPQVKSITGFVSEASKAAPGLIEKIQGYNQGAQNLSEKAGLPPLLSYFLGAGGATYLTLQAAKSAGKYGLNAIFGGGAGGAGTPSLASQAWQWLAPRALPAARAVLNNPYTQGIALGIAGYETMRNGLFDTPLGRFGRVPGFKETHASTLDIGSYLYQRATGSSDDEIHARAIRNGQKAAPQAASKTPLSDSFGKMVDNLKKQNFSSYVSQYQKPAWTGTVSNDPNAPQDWNHSLGRLRDGFVGKANQVEDWAKKEREGLGSLEERRRVYATIFEAAKDIKRGANASEGVNQGMNGFGERVAGRAAAYDAQDTYLNLQRLQ